MGLLGGSFDPVHEGHLELARRARAQAGCDEVWWIPAAAPRHKPAGPIASAEHRKRMLELALVGEEGMRIEDYELQRAAGQASVDTVRALVARHPGHRFHWLLGEDSFDSLDDWVEPETLLRLAPPVVLPRPGSTGHRPRYWRGVEVQWLEGPPLDLSSTGLRKELAGGRRPRGLPPAVAAYALRHRLYGSGTEGESP